MPLDKIEKHSDIKLYISISLRLDGHYTITLNTTDNLVMDDMKRLLDLCAWFDSCEFDHVVYKKFNSKEVVIIKYH